MEKKSLVDYELKEILPQIFALKIVDGYQRAMLFLRSQEFYESAFPQIRGKHFDIFEFMEIYKEWKLLDHFSYPADWAGFNVPGAIIEECIGHVLDQANGISATPYDKIMGDIVKGIRSKIGSEAKFYLLGVDAFESRTMDHELAHGLYHVNEEYKTRTSELVSALPSKVFEGMREHLLGMGYCEEVIPDEIQAYMATGLHGKMNLIRGIKGRTKDFSSALKTYI
jgi:hypothetical protein